MRRRALSVLLTAWLMLVVLAWPAPAADPEYVRYDKDVAYSGSLVFVQWGNLPVVGAPEQSFVVARLGGPNGPDIMMSAPGGYIPRPYYYERNGVGSFNGLVSFNQEHLRVLDTGTYRLHYSVYSPGTDPATATPLFTRESSIRYVPAPIPGVKVKIDPPAALPGQQIRIELQEGAMGQRAHVWLWSDTSDIRIDLGIQYQRLVTSAIVTPTLPADLPPGDYWVGYSATDPDYWPHGGGFTAKARLIVLDPSAGIQPGATQIHAVVTAQDGSLAMSVVGDTVTLEEPQLRGDRISYRGSFPSVSVTDWRSAATAGGDAGGWQVSTRSSGFSAGQHAFSAGYLGWRPVVSAGPSGVTAGPAVSGSLDGGQGLAVPQTLASATGSSRLGTSQLWAEVLLDVPVDTAPGSYTATATVSLFPVD